MERERAVDARVRAAGGSSEVDGDGSGNCGAGDGSDSGAGGNVGDSGDGNGGDSAGGDVLDGDSSEDHGEEETVKTPTDPRPVPVATKAKKDLGLQTFIITLLCENLCSPALPWSRSPSSPGPALAPKRPTHPLSCPVLNFMSLPQPPSDPLPRSIPLSLLSFKNANLRQVDAKASPPPTHQKAKPPCLAICLLLLPLSCRLPLPVRVFSGVTMAKTMYMCPSKSKTCYLMVQLSNN